MLSTISLDAAVGVWSDLEQAYYGDNGYGGSVAEIYGYRLMRYTPTALHAFAQGKSLASDPYTLEEMQAAARAFYDLLVSFAELRECAIEVDGRPLGDWVASTPFDHRHHVRVTPRFHPTSRVSPDE